MKHKTIEEKKKEYLDNLGKKHALLSELYQLKSEIYEKEARIKKIREIIKESSELGYNLDLKQKEDKKGVIN